MLSVTLVRASCMDIDVYKDTTSRLHRYGRVLSVVKSPSWMHLMSSRLFSRNYRITSSSRKEGIPVRVAHKSYTLRRALSHKNKERTCTRANSPISGTRLCLLRNAVYQITCNNCNQHCIGSTTSLIHDRVREHLNNNSSVKKNPSKCQNEVYKGIEIKSIVLKNDPANLRLFEAFYIRNHKPTI